MVTEFSSHRPTFLASLFFNPLMSTCKLCETLSVVSSVREIPKSPLAATEGQDETPRRRTLKVVNSVGLVRPSYGTKSRRTDLLKPSSAVVMSSTSELLTLYPSRLILYRR